MGQTLFLNVGKNIWNYVKGNLTLTGLYRVTYTNLDNNKSVIVHLPYRAEWADTYGEDGLVTTVETNSGPVMVKTPKGPAFWIEAGRVITRTVWDPESYETLSFEVLFEAGTSENVDILDALCQALAD